MTTSYQKEQILKQTNQGFLTYSFPEQSGTLATREWAVNKTMNQIPWSQDLIDSCVDLSGCTINFNIKSSYYHDSSNSPFCWPLAYTYLVSSGGYALGVYGPPNLELKGIDGKVFDTITFSTYQGKNVWHMSDFTLPDDFGYIVKAVYNAGGDPSISLDAVDINWNEWEFIIPGGFVKTPSYILSAPKVWSPNETIPRNYCNFNRSVLKPGHLYRIIVTENLNNIQCGGSLDFICNDYNTDNVAYGSLYYSEYDAETGTTYYPNAHLRYISNGLTDTLYIDSGDSQKTLSIRPESIKLVEVR
jgi:hypothetical protein